MTTDRERVTLFTARSTEEALMVFCAVGFLSLVSVLLYARFQEAGSWFSAWGAVWQNIPHILSFSTLLTIFKEGVEIMFWRLRAYRDGMEKMKERLEELETRVIDLGQQVAKAKEEGYKIGYDAAKAEEAQKHKQ